MRLEQVPINNEKPQGSCSYSVKWIGTSISVTVETGAWIHRLSGDSESPDHSAPTGSIDLIPAVKPKVASRSQMAKLPQD